MPVLWFTVWTLLVVGSLVGGFFLLRHVYRSGKALAAELGRASEVLGEAADKAQELAAALERLHPVTPVDLEDTEGPRRRLAEGRAASERRRRRRAARHEQVYARWRSFSR